MKRILLGMAAIALAGLSACADSASDSAQADSTEATATAENTESSPNLPVYEVTWDGYVGSDRVSDEVKAYVWGSPNPEERPEFNSTGALVVGLPDFQSETQDYKLAFESYGCFPAFSAPDEKALYLTGETVFLKRERRGEQARQIPIEVPVKPLDADTQQNLLIGSEAPQVAMPVGSCEAVE